MKWAQQSRKGHFATVQMLVEAKMDVNAVDKASQRPKVTRGGLGWVGDGVAGWEGGVSPLHGAVDGKSLEAIDALLEAKGDLNLQLSRGTVAHLAMTLYSRGDHNGRNVLCAAADAGVSEVLRRLLRHCAAKDPMEGRTPDLFGRTAVYAAAERGHQEVAWTGYGGVLEQLLEAECNVKDMPAAQRWQHLSDMVGHQQQDLDRNQRSALHAAALGGSALLLRLLLAARSDVHGRDRDGHTALHVAAEAGHAEVVDELLQGGSDLRCNAKGCTPLHLAARNGHRLCCLRLVSDGRATGRTAVHMAAWQGHPEVVEILLKARADPNHPDSHCHSALHLACDEGHHAVVQRLVAGQAR
eukprot:Skav223465  [mRNA]  locus=scaffold2238:70320:77924:+ [translate_table: standard]